MVMVSSSLGVKSIPIKPHAITTTLAIYGPDLPEVQGKIVRKKPKWVELGELDIPDHFHWIYHFATLTAMIFVNGVEFLTTLCRKLRLVTAEHVPTHRPNS